MTRETFEEFDKPIYVKTKTIAKIKLLSPSIDTTKTPAENVCYGRWDCNTNSCGTVEIDGIVYNIPFCQGFDKFFKEAEKIIQSHLVVEKYEKDWHDRYRVIVEEEGPSP